MTGQVARARCPAHDDRTPSLSVREENDGRVLIHCHAGCSADAVLAHLGLTLADLFPDSSNGSTPNVPTRTVATYVYVDAESRPLFRVVRYEPKTFRQQHPDGSGGWAWGRGGADPVLYRLPRVLTAFRAGRVVFVVEGEKDVESLQAIGLVATCNPGGAGKWHPALHALPLAGVNVVILPDADATGRSHARAVAQSLIDVAQRVCVIELPGLTEKGDVSDWLRAGHTRAELEELARQSPLYEPADDDHGADGILIKPNDGGFTTVTLGQLLSEEFRPLEYLVENLLPAGGLSILVAKPKVGKSTLARCLAMAVATGSDFLGRPTRQATVLYAALEESLASVQAHFRRLGATGDEPIHVTTGRTPTDAVNALGSKARSLRPGLVVVDPLVLLTRIRDASAYAEVYRALDPLIGLARETEAHVQLLHHSAKMERKGVDAPLGSTAFGGAVDLVLPLRRRKDGMRLLSSVQRDGNDLPKTVLEMDEETGLVTLAGSYADVRLNEVVEAMEEVLDQSDEPLTRDELFERVEAQGRLKSDALKTLKESDRLLIEGAGKRGDPLRYTLRKGCFRDSDATESKPAQTAQKKLFSCSDSRVGTREQETDDRSGDGHPALEAVSLDGSRDPWADVDPFS